jgi:hypothetical protein
VLKCSFSLFSTLSTVSVIEILVLETSTFARVQQTFLVKKTLYKVLSTQNR